MFRVSFRPLPQTPPGSPFDDSRDFIACCKSGQSKPGWYVEYTFKYTSVVRDILRAAAQDLYEDQAVVAFRQAHCATQSDQRDLTARAAVSALSCPLCIQNVVSILPNRSVSIMFSR